MPLVTYRLSQLPPYVLARVDELKSRLRAEGREIFDFGLGNPDGPSPAAAVDRLKAELGKPGLPALHAVAGSARAAPGDLRLVPAALRRDASIPTREAVVTIGSKEGIAHLLLACWARATACWRPIPGYPIHQLGRGDRRRRAGAGGGRPRTAITSREIEAALARSPRPPKGLIVNFPHNPTTATADLGFYEQGGRRWPCGEKLWVISDLAYADLCFDDRPAPSIFQVPGARDVAVEFFTVSKSYSMPGWRVGFCVGNPDLVGGLTTIKGYLDYGIFAPTQLAAATALTACDADVVGQPGALPAPGRRAGAGPARRRAGR